MTEQRRRPWSKDPSGGEIRRRSCRILVSLARAAGDNDKAEGYAIECLKEDQKNMGNLVANMLRGAQVPSGLYADCVQRLGHIPQSAQQNAAMDALKHPVEATKSLTEKVREKFRRNK